MLTINCYAGRLLIKNNYKKIKMKYPYSLPTLPYGYGDLEPYIDRMTMEIHHSKHHQSYIDNLNAALEKDKNLFDLSLEDILKNLNLVPEEIRSQVKNNGGGHYNHSLFWEVMAPAKTNNKPENDFLSILEKNFGSFEQFQQIFNNASKTHFASGWCWLVVDQEKKLKVYSLPNHDNPLSIGDFPLLTNDLWEHAYYLKYQNRRIDYIQAWWNVVNWHKVAERYFMMVS